MLRQRLWAVLAAVLVAAAAGVVSGPPAEAHHNEIEIEEAWSATLTVQAIPGSTILGCDTSASGATYWCRTAATLSDHTATINGTTHNVDSVTINDGGIFGTNGLLFDLRFFRGDPGTRAVLSEYTLHVDGTPFRVADSTQGCGNRKCAVWPNSGLTWSAGDKVKLSLTFARTRGAIAGDVDHSFGFNGSASAAFGSATSEIFDVAVQSDGRVVAVGFAANVNRHGNDLVASRDFAVARYNPDGSLDTTFGTGGRVLTDFTVPGAAGHRGLNDEARAVALQSDGKIVVAGYAASPNKGNEFVVARYNVDGTLDTGFGTNYAGVGRRGFAIHSFSSSNDAANAVAVQTVSGNEHILVAGQAGTSFGLVRYNTVGDPDGGFGAILNQHQRSGAATYDFSTLEDGATSLAVDSSNKIVVGGFATNNNGTTTGSNPTSDDHKDFALLRISTAGDPDSSFGVNSRVTTNFAAGSVEQINDIAIDSNNKIVAAGFRGSQWALARYNTNGALDGGFGEAKPGGQQGRQGRVIRSYESTVIDQFNRPSFTAPSGYSAQAHALQVLSDGKILLTGEATHPSKPNHVLLELLTAAGDIFQSSRAQAHFQGDFTLSDAVSDGARAMALTGANTVVLGGYNSIGSVNEFAVYGIDSGGNRNNGFGAKNTCAFKPGCVATSFGSQATAQAMAVQPDGKIVVAGYANNDNGTPADAGDDHNDIALTRYLPDGSVDLSGCGTINSRGRSVTDIGTGSDDRAYAVAIQSDGKIVVAGSTSSDGTVDKRNFTVLRYTDRCVLDTSFGDAGKVIFDFGGGGGQSQQEPAADEAFAVAIQADNKIIAAGYTAHGPDDDFAFIRFNTDGSTDNGRSQNFNVDDDRGYAIAIAANNRFIVAGGVRVDNGTPDNTADDHDDFGVAQIVSSDFSSDSNFGNFNPDTSIYDLPTVDFNTADDHAHALAIDADNKIIVAGHTTNDNDTASNTADDYTEFALARLNAGGTIDTSFGTSGKATTGFGAGGDDEINAIAIDSSGRIIAAGSANHGNSTDDFALTRYNTDGTLDTDFGVGGKVTTDFGSTNDAASAVALAADGKILAAGTSAGEFRVTRYRAQSSDATLSALTVATSSDGSTFGGAATLSPAFNSATTAYTLTLRSGVSHYRVTPTTGNAGATVTVNGSSVASGSASAAIAVTAGAATTVNVRVTAEDGTTRQTYTLTVNASSGDATLSGLSVSTSTDGSTFGGSAALSPGFSADETSYTANPAETTTHVKLTPTAKSSAATVTVDGASVTSGTAGAAIAVSLGATTTVNVVVTAEDTQITKTYTVEVTPLVDGPNTVKLQVVKTSIPESDKSATVAAVLDDPKTEGRNDPATTDVTVTLAAHTDSTAVAGQDYTLPGPQVIRRNLQTEVFTITLTRPDDEIDKGDKTLILIGTAGAGRTVVPLTLTLTDDDTAAVNVSTNRLNLADNGSYTLALNSEPTAEVVITAASGDETRATVRTLNTFNPGTLTFTAANWKTPQEVLVTRLSGTTTITHTATSTDPKYNNISIRPVTIAPPPPPPVNFGGGGGGAVGGGGGGDAPNEPPSFANASVTLTVAENTPPRTSVGDPIAATDPENDEIRYTLEGDDAALFAINPRTGQISVAARTRLDYETEPNTYPLRVTATDPDGSNTNNSITVTINVTNVTLPAAVAAYDADNNEQITLDELLAAIRAYRDERLTLTDLITIIRTYLTT